MGNKPCRHPNLVEMKLPWRAEQKAIREHPLYPWLWGHFVDWATTAAIKFQWPKYSMKMELTLDRAKPCNVVHLHMCVSDTERRHTIFQTEKSKWRYGRGCSPCVSMWRKRAPHRKKLEHHPLLLSSAENWFVVHGNQLPEVQSFLCRELRNLYIAEIVQDD